MQASTEGDNDASSSLSSFEEASRGANSGWVGGDVEFVKSRKEDGERRGKWNTEGLDSVALELVKGDKGAGK